MPPVPLPMLCTLVAEPFDNPAWIFEPKYDGLRVLSRSDGRELILFSRNQASDGGSSFRSLQQRYHLKNASEVQWSRAVDG